MVEYNTVGLLKVLFDRVVNWFSCCLLFKRIEGEFLLYVICILNYSLAKNLEDLEIFQISQFFKCSVSDDYIVSKCQG